MENRKRTMQIKFRVTEEERTFEEPADRHDLVSAPNARDHTLVLLLALTLGTNDEEVEEEDEYRQGKEHSHHALSPSRRAALAARRPSAGGTAGRNRRRRRSLIRQ